MWRSFFQQQSFSKIIVVFPPNLCSTVGLSGYFACLNTPYTDHWITKAGSYIKYTKRGKVLYPKPCAERLKREKTGKNVGQKKSWPCNVLHQRGCRRQKIYRLPWLNRKQIDILSVKRGPSRKFWMELTKTYFNVELHIQRRQNWKKRAIVQGAVYIAQVHIGHFIEGSSLPV